MKDRRFCDPYVDRRSADDRRLVYDAGYWEHGGQERRRVTDRRKPTERRVSYVKVSKWSSVRIGDTADKRYRQ
jgi:hypothetical protein